jgi:hypothetical protein
MSDYLDRLHDQLVDTSRRLHGRRRRRWARRGALTAGVVVLVGAPALAATGVWRPQIGDGNGPAPKITTQGPPADQLAMFGVLRRPQTAADRSSASRAALRLLRGTSVEGVRTGSIRLLARSSRDAGLVLVPVARYTPEKPALPADAPPELRKALDRPAIDDALCVFQLERDPDAGAGVVCWSTRDIRSGRAWQALGHRKFWLVSDGVAFIRTEYPGRKPVVTPVHDNTAVLTEPRIRGLSEARTTFLDASRTPVLVNEPPPPPPPADTDPRHGVQAPGSTHSGIVERVFITGTGLDARYGLLIQQPRMLTMRVILYRPACAGRRRVYDTPQGASPGAIYQRAVHPSLGDFHRARWCPGHYHGYLRETGTGKRLGTFSFEVSE